PCVTAHKPTVDQRDTVLPLFLHPAEGTSMMSTSVAPLEMADTDRYPLTEPDSPAWREIVARTRAELADVGCSVLADFVRPELREILRDECAALEPHAYTKIEQVNAYNIALGTPLPDDHPGR